MIFILLTSSAPFQDSDNPDLRDRGYIYWRLLSTDPVTAKEVVLSEKPLISEETDLIEPTLLDELICHIGSLASVYHKPPSAFVEGSHGIHRKHLPVQHSRSDNQCCCRHACRSIHHICTFKKKKKKSGSPVFQRFPDILLMLISTSSYAFLNFTQKVHIGYLCWFFHTEPMRYDEIFSLK